MSFIDSPEYDIRYTEAADHAALKRIVMKPDVMRWMVQSKESEIDLFVQNWIGFARFKSTLTCLYQGVPIAFGALFLYPYQKVCHMAMVQMVVDPEYQKRGVGKSLLKNLIHLAKTRFRFQSLHIDIPENSPGKRLLEKQGFKLVVKQADFYYIDGKYYARHVMERML
ncbi:MAG: GNAT family N-acetyltransferase [Chlamydiales bacterium]